ncbi:hypothetical protein HAX54_033784 [Datura stramonium]|uniref:Putative plant transposon protein domain-containing protein n=1 Tax=Datura stramonium TaxID=4076 RepID=A0ABS8VDL9_DATST|nr:hypothetical protein [Datura stramonium]
MWFDLVCSRLMPSQNTSELPIKVVILLVCIMEHVHINVGEIIANQFRKKAKQQATTLPFPTFVCILCLRAECPLLHSLDNAIRVHRVITLDTKIDKEALMIKWERYRGNMTPASPLASSHIASSPANTDESQTSPPPGLLNIAQMEMIHENQLQEVAILTVSTNQLTPFGPVVVPPQVEAPRSPLDDLWVGYHSNADIMCDEEEDYHNLPPPPQMHSVYDVNPSWDSGGVATTSYHEL